MGPVYFIDCAKIKDASWAALESVELAFALMGHDGSRIGRVLTYDVPPSEIPAEGSTGSVCQKNCYAELRARGFSNLPAPEMFYDGQKVSLIVRITQVAFSDGSKFRAELP